MSKLLEEIKHGMDATIPEIEDLSHMTHPKIDYMLLVLRNAFVLAAAILFILSFFLHGAYNALKAAGYFCGATAYLFECLAATDCFKTKVEHHEMFMVYCFGPLYLIMGLNYILWH